MIQVTTKTVKTYVIEIDESAKIYLSGLLQNYLGEGTESFIDGRIRAELFEALNPPRETKV